MRLRHNLTTFSCACAWLIVVLVVPAQSQTEIVEKYNRAIESPTGQKIALLQEVIRDAPNFLEARYALGVTYYAEENYKAAVPHFEHILARPQ